MAHLITFLGKGGVGCTTSAIATAKKLAKNGDRVLLATQDPSPAFGLLLGRSVGIEPEEIEPNLWAVQFDTPFLLAKGWEEIKEMEAKYLRFSTLKNIYGQELGTFPGFESALGLYEIRNYNASQQFDAIVYDGTADLALISALGVPENTSWYIRRFRELILESDLGKALSPFVQPITAAIFNVSWSLENFAEQPLNETKTLLEEGIDAVCDPKRAIAYLVTNNDPVAIATAKYLWGSAQLAGVSVGGVLWNRESADRQLTAEFSPLSCTELPQTTDLEAIADALPNIREVGDIPKPLQIDTTKRQAKVFLPGFDKKQVKLTQYGTEITIEAGDRRRNIILPPPLTGQPVKGAKFQDNYLILSL
ncbi:ArsA family ATPase [Spirulina sp. 06S082]|uniref:Get3/ArsA fold putative tail anchor-mediating ATPase NosAFP n=1 Tax=Spirulina sp. 06S082 TaxID=3110248 RepID=UPI002B213DE4|nr:ArsA family ATPase [Spirulina sp. 06S082]MEA5470872.1 ArsA family ATPase [Spirulina sp. 06S082]